MNDLYKALGDISSIRRQVAGTTEFRGYGPATLAATGFFAIAAAAIQSRLVPDTTSHIRAYLALWTATATLAIALTGVQMLTRSRRLHSALSGEMIRMAVEQFLPSFVTGVLLTFVLLRYASDSAWMLPGLWQVIFSLGVVSSCRFLPRPMLAAGVWYLTAGLAVIAIGPARALSPWAMGIPFGAGQMLVAAILWLKGKEAADEV